MDRDRYWFKNGTLYGNTDRQVTSVLLGSADDLESDVLKAKLEPGTVAHIAGGSKYYELSPNFEWIECVNRGGSNSSGSGSGGSGTPITDGETVIVEGMSADERVNAG